MQRQILSVSSQVHTIVTADIDFIEKLHRLFTFMGNTIAYVSQRFQDDLKRIKPELWGLSKEELKDIKESLEEMK